MQSLMQKHRARIAAQKARPGAEAEVIARMPQAAPAAPANTPFGRQKLSALLAASIEEDLRALKNMTIERKGQFKRDELLPRYREQVKRLLDAGHPDPAVGRYLVWCFDAGQVEEGLELAKWCLEHGQGLPDGFSSTLHFFVASQVLAWAEAQQKAAHSCEPYLGDTLEAMERDNWDVPDKIKAGFHKLKAQAAESGGELAEAVTAYEKAFALGAKVETKLNAARKKLEKATEPGQ